MAKILFVEDEKFNMQSFIWELEETDHQIIVVNGGEEAIRSLKSGGHDFDLIILDIMLPRGDHKGSPAVGDDIKTGEMGLEILRQLREEMNDETPVIVLTAVMDDDLKARMLRYGVAKHFAKPVPMTDFMDALEAALSS